MGGREGAGCPGSSPPTALHCRAALTQPPGSSEPRQSWGTHGQKCQGPSEALGLCPVCPRLLAAHPGTGAPLGPYVEGHGSGGGVEMGPWVEIQAGTVITPLLRLDSDPRR